MLGLRTHLVQELNFGTVDGLFYVYVMLFNSE